MPRGVLTSRRASARVAQEPKSRLPLCRAEPWGYSLTVHFKLLAIQPNASRSRIAKMLNPCADVRNWEKVTTTADQLITTPSGFSAYRTRFGVECLSYKAHISRLRDECS